MKVYATFESLQASVQTLVGSEFVVRDRANANYILQAIGYTALVGDATLANGRVAKLQVNSALPANALNFGALSTETIEAAIGVINDVGLPREVILANQTINATSKPFLNLSGSASTELRRDAASGNCVQIEDSDYAGLKNLTVRLENKNPLLRGHGTTILNSDYSFIDNVHYRGIDGDGFGCFIFGNTSDLPWGCRIENTTHEGTDVAIDNRPHGGAMLSDCEFGLMSNTWTKGIERFPVELKGSASYCIVENSFIQDAAYGLYYGAQGSIHPTSNIANNVVVKSVDMAVYSGYGSHNIFNNLLIDIGTNDGSKIGNSITVGVKIINGTDSLYTNILTKKDTGTLNIPVEISGTSLRNHVSIAPRHASAQAVTINSGAEKNSVEILGAGAFTSIFATNVITYNAPLHSGGAGNAVYNHSTGEYWGTLSGRYRWRIEEAVAATLFSVDRFVFDSPAALNTRLTITCADAANGGLAVVTPTQRGEFLYRPDFGGWQIGTTSDAYRFYPTSFRPLTTNVSSLGVSGALWSEVFAANGTINTSDQRLKTELLDIDAAELAAAVEIKSNIKKFRMLDSVSKKGDAARIHFGVGAQTVKTIFESHGLDAHGYSLFCYDEWEFEPEEVDEAGNVTYAGREAGNAYGIRYDQLSMFLLATL